MKNAIIISFLCFIVSSCGKTFKKEGNIEFWRGGEACSERVKNHWLLDVQATNASDSVYLNTNALHRKLELQRLMLDTTTVFYKLLSQTCKGDSLEMKIPANEFYTGLGGAVPENLGVNEVLKIKIWMRDMLDDMGHIAYKKLFESEMMSRYIQQNKWNATRDSNTLIYFERLKTNDNPRGTSDKTEISFVLKSLSEYVFAGTQVGKPYIYNPQDANLLPGIRFLMVNLAVGESVRAILPSDQAFGSNGNTTIPGYTPILVEIEVLAKSK
jgi:hypothetical protein